MNPHAKSESYKPKLEDEETINSWGLDPAGAKPVEGTIESYLDNPQSRLESKFFFFIFNLIWFVLTTAIVQ